MRVGSLANLDVRLEQHRAATRRCAGASGKAADVRRLRHRRVGGTLLASGCPEQRTRTMRDKTHRVIPVLRTRPSRAVATVVASLALLSLSVALTGAPAAAGIPTTW